METFNFSSLQQKADQVLHNADEAIRKWIDLTFAPAKDVPIEYYDKNGKLVQATVPNRAKLFNDLLVNVNSAMTKVFYVDTVNGSDNNDGSSTTPFKTLQKAVDSVPVGGFGDIRLVSDYTGTFDAHFKKLRIVIESGKVWTIPIGHKCAIQGCQITIINQGQLIIDRGDGSNINGDNYAGFFVSNFETEPTLGMTTNLYIVNLRTTNPIRIDADRALFGSRTWGTNQNIQMNLGVYNIYCDGDFIIDGLLMRLNNGCGSFQWNNAGNASTFRIVDSNGTAVDVKTKIGGIIKDTNNVPRNIMSNLIL